MRATCWPDVPGRDCQECRAPAWPWPRPAARAPPPHGPGRLGVHTPQSLLSWLSRSCVQGRGWLEADTPPGPTSVRLRLRVAGAWAQRFLGPQLHLNLVGRRRQGGPATSPVPAGDPHCTHLQQPTLLLLALQLLPDIRQLFPASKRARGRGGPGLASSRPLPFSFPPPPCPPPLTPSAPPSAPGPSLKTPPLPLASSHPPCRFCCLWDFVAPVNGRWESLDGLE